MGLTLLTEVPDPKSIKVIPAMERDSESLAEDTAILLDKTIRTASEVWYSDTKTRLSGSCSSKDATKAVVQKFKKAGWDCDMFAVGSSYCRYYVQLYNPTSKRNRIVKVISAWANQYI